MQIKSCIVILTVFKIVVIFDGFLLLGSAGPLTARLGGAVLLPCFVDRPLPLEELEVDWRRTDSDTIVHLFQGGQSRPESQGDAYRGRTHFFSQEIPKGNFSLLLEEVRTADAGVYKCVVYTEQEQRETWVEIREVERLVVTGADEPVYAHAGEDVTLSCSVDTHVNVTELHVEWRKTDDDGDILVLLYADGENRPESQDGRYSGRAEFFTEEIPKGNFSMKLRKVRMEDKGEFRCKVHSDTDSANTTARIAALGYSSLHWLILWLCIAVTPVVLLTGALSVRHLRREDKSKQALLSHCSYLTVPPIMVSAAFILWGVTEGSTEEAVTYPAISLHYILVLFIMAPYRKSFTDTRQLIIHFTLRATFPIIMLTALTGSFIELLAKFSPTPAQKAAFGVMLGGITFVYIFFIICQIAFVVVLAKYSEDSEKVQKILEYVGGITEIIFLLISVSSIIAVSVYLAKYSALPWEEQLATLSTLLMFPAIMVLFPVGLGVFRIIRLRRMGETVRLRDILAIMASFLYDPTLCTILSLANYSHVFAWMNGIFILKYSIPISVASLGISACIIIKDYLLYIEKKRLEGFYFFAQKILLGIFFLLHLILSFLYLSVILENDKGRPVKICEFVFVYILTVTFLFRSWEREHLLVKPRKYVYLSGTFALPLLNSVALAVVLILKADTGKQPLDLRLIVLISGSVFLFSRFVIEVSAYWLAKKEKLKRQLGLVERLQDTELQLLQPQVPTATIPGPLADLGKCKLIREQLLLLLHARICRQRKQTNRKSWSCSRPQCCTMRRVLKHRDSCQAGTSCQVKHCTSSCQIISHWENCTQDDCPICMPSENMSINADSRKLELMQGRLLLLLHAQECQRREQANGEEWLCSRSQCCNMRKLLKHMTHCQVGMTCQEDLCTLSCQIISHWETCTQDNCLTLHF
ncbi:uncharacterized protein LOC125705351 [Brienomyrus brachyistius]|uniref:uncharacterized protein LOC125705351 n=1 Tax=Brienomyrus brachyistius TaxID=42636 RepID=UPI0020B3AC29|nr:uncharacterized protein LOC125705351 [Brienomyrus brachyistius]